MTRKTNKNNIKNCFVIMPIIVPQKMIDDNTYDDINHFKVVYEYLIEPAIKENNWNPIYPQTKGSEIIISDIIEHLLNSEMVICDISILNPNVFYEAGIRTALNKPIAYIKDDAIKKIPFDTSGINHETYRKSLKANYVEEDKKKLREHIKTTYEKSRNINLAWKRFGLQITAEKPVIPKNPTDAKIDIMLNRIDEFEERMSMNISAIRDNIPFDNPIPTDRETISMGNALGEIGKLKFSKGKIKSLQVLPDKITIIVDKISNFDNIELKNLRYTGNKYGFKVHITDKKF